LITFTFIYFSLQGSNVSKPVVITEKVEISKVKNEDKKEEENAKVKLFIGITTSYTKKGYPKTS
jgi:hypothetical protein